MVQELSFVKSSHTHSLHSSLSQCMTALRRLQMPKFLIESCGLCHLQILPTTESSE